MRHLDLCSGIGGFALAARWMGWETIGFAEIDEFASKVLEKNWPGVPNYGDIATIPDGIRADLITAGFPCQPYSVAGQRLGAEDDRAIWPLVIEVVRQVKPDWCVFENVAGIINMALDGVLSDMEEEGYEVWTVVLPACAVNAPHRRDRVWIVANASDDGSGARERPNICRTREEIASASDALAHPAIRPNQQSESRPSERALSGRDEKGDGDVSDADRPRRIKQRRSFAISEKQLTAECGGEWQLESPVCGMADGVSRGLDGYFDCEPDIPRVATGIKDRAKRLKALGNAIVPQVVHKIFQAIEYSQTKKAQ